MALCPFCRLHTFQLGDQFCGLCGKPLCRLVVEQGLYVELPEEPKTGLVTQELLVRNAGWSILTLRLRDSVDSAVRLRTREQALLQLDPGVEATRLLFEVDLSKVTRRKNKVCCVDFESSDPRLARGSLRFGFPIPAAIALETNAVDFDKELVTSVPEAGERHERPFEVLVSNAGGRKVHVTLLGGRDDPTEYPIQVALAEGDSFDLEGYAERVPIPLRAWTMVEREKTNDFFVLLCQSKDGTTDHRIEISAPRCARPPLLEARPFEVAELMPGLACQAGSGQTRLGKAEVYNRGGSSCKIMEVFSESRFVRVLPDQLPAEIKPGARKDIEFVLSTRADGEHVTEDRRLPINLWLSTDSSHVGEIVVRGAAQLRVPAQSRGLMAVDFGTINSCVAYMDEGRPEPVLVEDEETHERFVPSMMIFVEKLYRYEDWLLHGPDVQGNRPYTHARGVIHSVKRAIEEDKWQVYDGTYSGQQLATWIIEQLLLEAGRRHNCRPERVAMTIPAAFWGPKRTAMLSACKEACRLAWGTEAITPTPIDEATAAAMYFHFRNRSFVSKRIRDHGVFRVLVFDFGGGTLDISVVEFTKDEHGMLNVSPVIARGDNHMGGIDLDVELVRALAKKAKAEHPQVPESAISSSRWEFNRRFSKRKGFPMLSGMRSQWYQKAKQLKEELTDLPAVDFALEVIYDANGNELTREGSRFEFHCTVTRADFEEMIGGRIRRATHLVASTLDSRSLRPELIDAVLLTGQSSRIPCFQTAVRGMFSHLSPEIRDITIPLKESVAAGAAWAAIEDAHGRVRLHGLNRTSYRYGIEGAWANQPERFLELIPLNSDFGAAQRAITLRLDPGEQRCREMNIIQNGTRSDDILPDGKDPDVTAIGKVDLTPYPPGELEFSLFFSTDTGMLAAEVNGQGVTIQPVQDEASEAIYL